VVIGLGGDHEAPRAVPGGAAGGLDDEARADPLATVVRRGIDGLKAAPLAGDDDPAGGDDLVAAGIHRHEPGASACAEHHAEVFEPPAEELPVGPLV
jgi:hypothetical protein